MSFTAFSVAVLALFAVALLLELYRGLHRGATRTILSFVTILISVLLALAVAPPVASLFFGTIANLVDGWSVLASMSESFPYLHHLILLCLTMLASSILFVVLFFVFRLIFAIIMGIFYRTSLKKQKDDPGFHRDASSWLSRHERIVSVLVSVASAFVITTVILSPVMGTMELVTEVNELTEKTNNSGAFGWNKELMDGVEECSNDIPGNVFYQVGGKMMYTAAAGLDMDGRRVHLLNEVKTAGLLIDDFQAVTPVFRSPEMVNAQDLERLELMCRHIEDLELGGLLLAEYLPRFSNAWLEGKSYFDIEKPAFNDLLEPTFDEILRVSAQVEVSTARANTVTLLRSYGIILESGLIALEDSDYESVLLAIEESDIINRLSEELGENVAMQGLTESLSAIAMGVIAKEIDDLNRYGEEYQDLMGNLADAVNNVQNRGYGTDEEKVTVLTSYAKQYLDDCGVPVSDSVAEFAAGELFEKISATGSSYVSAADIEQFFADYLN